MVCGWSVDGNRNAHGKVRVGMGRQWDRLGMDWWYYGMAILPVDLAVGSGYCWGENDPILVKSSLDNENMSHLSNREEWAPPGWIFFGIISARTLGKKRVFTYLVVILFLVSVKVNEMDGERIGNIVRPDHTYLDTLPMA